ncbi:alpha-ketoglutarate-dependent dioxygenase alkB homolog 4 [Bacillus rossius redtenbacheri]|uniref:alpha-ketoglutarate-dependent dioxygenase alkB homolog 4 n=1 Tax=Bacillus rossius redtenbacheri TaxID=93214 RepID=UPI002FDCBA10
MVDRLIRDCGCKGVRTCLVCEKEYNLPKKEYTSLKEHKKTYVYCPSCNKAWPGWDVNATNHPIHTGEPLDFQGIFIQENFITPAEESLLIEGIDNIQWEKSQSGRRKQNYGPKCNFKKKNLKVGDFNGFPEFSKFVQDKFKNVDMLKNYQTIEQCSLEYDADKGASIDPHIDDCWVWGERIVTVNLLEDSVLTLTPYHGELSRYNLSDVESYPPVLDRNGQVIEDEVENCSLNMYNLQNQHDVVIRVPMPRYSLLVMFGFARYVWEHCVLREDIIKRRVCLAYREFTPLYLKGGHYEKIGQEIITKAQQFWNHKKKTS